MSTVVTVTVPNRINSINNNLISYWKLDESSGTRFDMIGFNHLSNNNGVTSAAGKIGNASVFASASTQYLSIASNSSLQIGSSSFTFAGWVKFTTVSASMDMINKLSTGGTGLEYMLDFSFATNRMRLSISTDGTTTTNVSANSFGAPSTGIWYFIVCWFNVSDGTLNIQINNGPVDSVATGYTQVYVGTTQFNLGRAESAISDYRYLNGSLDEVGFWKKVLTDQERSYLYNYGMGRTIPFN
jgi:Concanavalin A-like lectin/glucanases superfamily